MLAVLTSYFNPCNCKFRLDNFHKFTENLHRQGIDFFVAELSMIGHEHHLNPATTPNLIQLSTQSLMFQKERLLNILLEKLPAQFDAVCWMDSDIIYLCDGWQHRIIDNLQNNTVVQPYQYAVSLPSCDIGFPFLNDMRAYNCTGSSIVRKGIAFHLSQTGDASYHGGHVGYVWAARREFLEKHRFYDAIVTGAGDLFMAMAFFNAPEWIEASPSLKGMSDEAVNHFFDWHYEVIKDVNEVGFTQDLVMHLWHGDIDKRNYLQFSGVLQQFNFNPNVDLCISDNGCWEWSTDKQDLHNAVQQIFRAEHLS